MASEFKMLQNADPLFVCNAALCKIILKGQLLMPTSFQGVVAVLYM